MTSKEKYLYRQGYDRGYSIANWIDVPSVGEEVPKDMDWQGIAIIETPEDAMDAMGIYAFQGEEIDRQFSPFEFQAKEINTYENWQMNHNREPSGWEWFDEGIKDGIQNNIQARSQGIIAYFEEEED